MVEKNFTLKQAVEELRKAGLIVNVDVLRRWCTENKCPHIRLGNRYYIKKSTIDDVSSGKLTIGYHVIGDDVAEYYKRS